MSKPTLLLYSECPFFGGCENLLSLLTHSVRLRAEFNVVFAYGYNREYELVARTRIPFDVIHTIPVVTGSAESLLFKLNVFAGKSRIHLVTAKFLTYAILVPRKLGVLFPYQFIRFYTLVKKINPDVIHVNNGGYPGALSARMLVWTAKKAGYRNTIMTVNNIAAKPRYAIERCFDRWIFSGLKKITTASKNAASALQANRNVDPVYLAVVPNSIETPAPTVSRAETLKLHGIPEDHFVISEIALLTERKGQKYLIEAIGKIATERREIYKNISIIFVGDGEDRASLQSLAVRLGVAERVIFAGTRANYSDYIQAADLIIQPSTRNEDMPLIILSAMEMGKPVIATDVGGIAEQIRDGQEGTVLSPAQLAELHQAILRLYADAALRNRFAACAKKRFFEMFSKEKVEQSYLMLYHEVMGVPT